MVDVVIGVLAVSVVVFVIVKSIIDKSKGKKCCCSDCGKCKGCRRYELKENEEK